MAALFCPRTDPLILFIFEMRPAVFHAEKRVFHAKNSLSGRYLFIINCHLEVPDMNINRTTMMEVFEATGFIAILTIE